MIKFSQGKLYIDVQTPQSFEVLLLATLQRVVLSLDAGLKITTGHRTMSGQDNYLSGQNLGLAVILTGHGRHSAKLCQRITSVLLKVIPEFCIAHSYWAQFFASSAHEHVHAHIQNIRDFPQTKLDSEIKALFLLNRHGDLHFLFYKFNENNIRNNCEKIWQKCMATFFANEINATDRHNAPNRSSPNYVSFKG